VEWERNNQGRITAPSLNDFHHHSKIKFYFPECPYFSCYHCSGEILRAKTKQHIPPLSFFIYLKEGKNWKEKAFHFYLVLSGSAECARGSKWLKNK
jgi:hypothetical protein